MDSTTGRRYRDRVAELLREIADRNEDISEIRTEMRSIGANDRQIKGVMRAARRVLWGVIRRAREEEIGQYVLELEAADFQEAAE
jgi:uncharacterized protein (UPF0335 family)